MFLPSWLQSWKHGGPNRRTDRAGRPGQRRVRVALTLESLEDRMAPAVLTVTNAADMHQDELLTLREAVALANADASSGQSDTIDFDASLGNATITLTAGELELSGASGNATTTIDGAGRITVSGNHASRVFQIDAGVHAELDGLTLTDGRVVATSPQAGGGIYNVGTLTVRGSTLSGNFVDGYGGGVYNAGTLTVTDSILSGDNATDGGGGIYNSANLTVSDSTLSGNSVSYLSEDGGGIDNVGGASAQITHCTIRNNSVRPGGLGGGLYNGGTMTVSDSTIDGNTGGYGGGGIENLFGTLTVSRTTFAGNSAAIGAGIDNDWGTLTVSNSTFAGNSATDDGGGGISNYAGPVTVSDCTFAANTATYNGGAILNQVGPMTVIDSTLVGNTATYSFPSGGGICNFGAQLMLSDSIVAGNTASSGPDVSGPVDARSSYNVIGNGNGLTGISDGVNHNQIGTPANPIDPLLASLGNYGGPTQTFALLVGSPALAAGGASTMLTSPVNATATSLNVDSAASLAVSPGLTIQIDGEQLLITAVNTTSNTFTVVRGVNGTAVVAHDAGAGLFPAADQRGAPRVVNGSLDIGSYQSQPATRLVLSVAGGVSAGTAFTLTVTAYDAYGNVAIGYTGTVTFVSTDPAAQLPPDYPFSTSDAGTHDFVTTLFASGSRVTLFVGDSTTNLTASLDVLVS
jgi:predicted outer membrane repeat protein